MFGLRLHVHQFSEALAALVVEYHAKVIDQHKHDFLSLVEVLDSIVEDKVLVT